MDISLCIYDSETGMLQFAAAHNPLFIINGDQPEEIKADKIGIGSSNTDKKSYNNRKIKLKKGDQLYLFSDGYPDQFGGPNGKKYMYKRFREFLLKISNETMERQKWLLEEEIENWSLGYPKVDDIMVMGVKVDEQLKGY